MNKRRRSRALTDEELLQVRIAIENGVPMSRAVEEIDVREEGGKAAVHPDVSAVWRRLDLEYPGWMEDMRRKGLMGRVKGAKGKAREAEIAQLAQHPAVIAVMGGATYAAAGENNLRSDGTPIPVNTLFKWVKKVREYTGQKPPNTRNRRPKTTAKEDARL